MSYTRFPPTITLPITVTQGGTGSTAALVNGRVMASAAGAIAESALTVTGITPELPAVNKWVFISQYGNDTTGDGTYDHPYATPTKAMSIITDASSTLRYGIHVRGTISDTTVYIKPYTWYFGDTWGCSRLNATSTNAIQLFPGAYTTGNSRSGMTNVYMTGSTGISFDFVAQTASGSHVVEIDNVGVNGAVVINSNNNNQYFQWRSALCFSDFTVHGANGFIFDTFIAGNTLIDNGTAALAGAGLNILNSFMGTNFTITGDGTHANPVQVTTSSVGGTTTATGIGTTLYTDAVSISLKGSTTISGGASLVRTTDVYPIGYTPSNSAVWNSAPSDAQTALDILGQAPQWHKYSVVHTALQAAATTNDIQLFSLPAKTFIHKVVIKNTTAFAGTTTYTLSVGINGSLVKYLAPFDVKQAVSNTTFGVSIVNETMEDFGSAVSIRLAATSTVQNLNQSTAGAVDVYVLTSLLP